MVATVDVSVGAETVVFVAFSAVNAWVELAMEFGVTCCSSAE